MTSSREAARAQRKSDTIAAGIRDMANTARTAANIAQGDWGNELDLLDPRELGPLAKELREGEAALRKLRTRLEALQAGVGRTCPAPGIDEELCNRPVVGRPDAVYCSSDCRVRAHRLKRRSTAHA